MEATQYLVLRETIPVESLQLGGLSTSFRHPAEDYHFPKGFKGLQRTHQSVDHDVEQLMTMSKHVGGILSNLLPRSVLSPQRFEKSLELKSVRCCLYELENPYSWFQDICRGSETRDWLLMRLKDRQEVFLLTGYRTMQDGILEKSHNIFDTPFMTASAPGDFSSQPPRSAGSFEVESDSLHPDNQMSNTVYDISEEAIFAVSFCKVRLRKFGLSKDATLQRDKSWLRPWGWRTSSAKKTGTSKFLVTGETSEQTVNDEKIIVRQREASVVKAVSHENYRLASTKDQPVSAREAYEFTDFGPRSEGNDDTSSVFHSGTKVPAQATATHELILDSEDFSEVIQVRDPKIWGADLSTGGSVNDDHWSGTTSMTMSLNVKSFAAMRSFVGVFLSDAGICALLTEARRCAPYDKLHNVLQELFFQYAQHLSREGDTNSRELADIVRQYDRRIATLLARTVYQDEDHEQKTTDFSFTGFPSKQVDYYMFQLNSAEEPVTLEDSHKNDHSNNDSDPDEDSQSRSFPDQEYRREFIVSGVPFTHFKNSLNTFVKRAIEERQKQTSRNLQHEESVVHRLRIKVLFSSIANLIVVGLFMASVFRVVRALISLLCIVALHMAQNIKNIFPHGINTAPLSVYPSALASMIGDNLVRYAMYLKSLFRPPVRRGFKRTEWECVSI